VLPASRLSWGGQTNGAGRAKSVVRASGADLRSERHDGCTKDSLTAGRWPSREVWVGRLLLITAAESLHDCLADLSAKWHGHRVDFFGGEPAVVVGIETAELLFESLRY
jgi:hypothetical protein